MNDLLTGKRKIIKKPWKPKFNEKYFTCLCGDVCEKLWHYSMIDLMSYATGNCFKTREESEAHRKGILERLQKIYNDDTPLVGADEI